MSKLKLRIAGLSLFGVLAVGLPACTDEATNKNADVYQPSQSTQSVQEVEVDDYGGDGDEKDQALPAVAHRTITFVGSSTQLSSAAEKSLERMTMSLNSDLSTHMIIRTVDPNDVSVDEVSQLTARRVEALKGFLERHGVSVVDVRLDQYSAREFTSAQDSQFAQKGVRAETATDDPQAGASGSDPRAEQEVVITIVSTTM